MANEPERLDYVILSPKGVVQRIPSEGFDERAAAKTKLAARKAIDGWRGVRDDATELKLHKVNLDAFNSAWEHSKPYDLGAPVVDF